MKKTEKGAFARRIRVAQRGAENEAFIRRFHRFTPLGAGWFNDLRGPRMMFPVFLSPGNCGNSGMRCGDGMVTYSRQMDNDFEKSKNE
jgi:hypothetical protein